MNGAGLLKTREQRIVACLQSALPQDVQSLKALRARALDLPAMLRRHGLMHVLLFLAGKQGSDRDLANFLYRGIAAALDEPLNANDVRAYGESLAGLEFPLYLLHGEAAQESATWLKLLIEARTKVPATPPAENNEVQE